MRGTHGVRVSHARNQRTFTRFARPVGVLAAVLALLGTALVVLSSAAANADPGAGNLGICHATNSNSNPYVSESPNINATGLHGGHIGHTGPIWNPGLKAAGIAWGDIIPPFTYTNTSGKVVNFPGQNWTAEGQAILNNGCGIPTTVTPQDPSVTQSSCAGGTPSAPKLTFASTPGVRYSPSVGGPYAAGQTVVVTATTTSVAYWFQAPLPKGWTLLGPSSATFSVTFAAAPLCTIAPVTPSFTQAGCAAGAVVPPVLTLPGAPAGVSYKASGPAASNTTVTVTATITDPATNQFTAATLPAGWHYVSPTEATYDVVFATDPDCSSGKTSLLPAAPTPTQSTCVAGAPSVPTLGQPADGGGISYTASPAGPYSAGDTVTITATIDEPGKYEFVDGTLPSGWTFVNASTVTYTVQFTTPTCPAAVTPLAPTITQSSCVVGAPSNPTLTLRTTTGLDYTADKVAPFSPGQTVTVTATITDAAKYAFGPLPVGWAAHGPNEAQYVVTFDPAPACGGGAGPVTVVPQDPAITQSVCVAGVPTAPTLDAATEPPGISYRLSPTSGYAAGGTATVTATLTDPAAYAFGALPHGWTLDAGGTSATFTVTFAAAPTCSDVGGVEVVSARPSFTDPTCRNGQPTEPSYRLPGRAGVTYYVDGTATPAGTHTATPGSTITVKVRPPAGVDLAGGRDTFTHTFADQPECSGVGGEVTGPPAPGPNSGPTEPLAETGTPIRPLLITGGLSLLVGGALLALMLAVGHRRRAL